MCGGRKVQADNNYCNCLSCTYHDKNKALSVKNKKQNNDLEVLESISYSVFNIRLQIDL